MSVKVNIHPTLHYLTNDTDIAEVSGSTVGECLNDLIKQFPDIKPGLFDKKGKLLNYADIYVNLESAYPEDLAKPVKDGDEIHIVLILAGG